MDSVGGLLVVLGAALLAGAAFLSGSYLLLVHVMPPVLLVAALIGLVAGVVVGVVAVVTAYAASPDTLSPRTYRDERSGSQGGLGPDPGWPAYGLTQAGRDVSRCWSVAAAIGERPWTLATDAFFGGKYGDRRAWWLFWPIPAVALLALSAMTFSTVGVCLLVTALAAAVASVIVVAQFLVAGLIRVLEAVRQRLLGAEASCPHCYYVSPRPAYRCSCNELHRDIRPGMLGVLVRRCECGRIHPTTVLRADGHFPAVCQRCEAPLRGGAATVRDVRIPVVGDVSAGKTRFLYAVLDEMTASAQAGGVAFEHPDEDTRREAERALHVIRSGHDTAKTSPGLLPTALTCSIGRGTGRSLVHLFDAAGEQYGDGTLHDELGFLQRSRCIAFVVDPFSIPGIRERMAGVAPQFQTESAGQDVESFYAGVVHRIRDSGTKASEQRLAVVVSRADQLEAAEIAVPKESDEVAQWLSDLGLHNVVLSARRDFADVRFFVVHSAAHGAASPGRSVAPAARWLLSASGIKALAQAEKEVAPA